MLKAKIEKIADNDYMLKLYLQEFIGRRPANF